MFNDVTSAGRGHYNHDSDSHYYSASVFNHGTSRNADYNLQGKRFHYSDSDQSAASMFNYGTSAGNCNYNYNYGQSYSSSNLKSSGLRHRYKNWDEERRWRLTASTFSSAIGFWKGRRVHLWMEKIGLVEPFKGCPATCWSNLHEHIALARYQLMTGNVVTLTGFYLHGENHWLAASPDGIIDQGPDGYFEEGGLLEIKCPYFQGNANWSFPWSTIPPCYMPQAQGVMEILDRNWIDFYVWTPNGSSLFRIQRNPHYWDLMMAALSDFWWKHVEPAKEIRAMDADRNIVKLKPSAKHTLFEAIWKKSEELSQDSRLLVMEIHGKIRT